MFIKKKIKVIDGDQRINECCSTVKNPLNQLLQSGMELRGIQVFHYASLHYNSRWNNYPMRFINALVNSLVSFEKSNEYLCLNNREDHELQGNSSEILAIGLSNMFMCKWYGININRIEKVDGTKKRCDFRFKYNHEIIVFESKGRADSYIKAALRDCKIKKAKSVGDVKYSTICHLPRDNTPVTLHLYDPPINGDEIGYDEKYILIKHYKKLVEKSGLTILASLIGKRISSYKQIGEWNLEPLEETNVYKIGTEIEYGPHTFWTRQNLNYYTINDVEYYIQFGIEKKVLDLLLAWDLEGLSLIAYEETIVSDEGLSILSDGSMFIFRKK